MHCGRFGSFFMADQVEVFVFSSLKIMASGSLMRPKRSTGDQTGNAGVGCSSASPAARTGRTLECVWSLSICKAQGQERWLQSALEHSLGICFHEGTLGDLLPQIGLPKARPFA